MGKQWHSDNMRTITSGSIRRFVPKSWRSFPEICSGLRQQSVCSGTRKVVVPYAVSPVPVIQVYRPPIQGGPGTTSQSRAAKLASVFDNSDVTEKRGKAAVTKDTREEERPSGCVSVVDPIGEYPDNSWDVYLPDTRDWRRW